MSGQDGFKEMFPDFEGDMPTWGLWVWLTLHFNAHERCLISIKEVARRSGYTPRKIRYFLSRLEKMKLVELFFIKSRGVEIAILPPQPVLHSTTPVLHSTTPVLHSTTPVLHSTGLTKDEPYAKKDLSLYFSFGEELKLSSKTESKLEPSHARETKLIPSQEKKPRKKRIRSEKEITLGTMIFQAYADEYCRVHGIKLERTRVFAGMCFRLGECMGEEALGVVRFYCHHKDRFYFQNQHPLNLLVRDWQRIFADFKKGKTIARGDASFAERFNANWEAIKDL